MFWVNSGHQGQRPPCERGELAWWGQTGWTVPSWDTLSQWEGIALGIKILGSEKQRSKEFLEAVFCLLPRLPSVGRLLLSSNPDRYWTQEIGYDWGLTSLERLDLLSLSLTKSSLTPKASSRSFANQIYAKPPVTRRRCYYLAQNHCLLWQPQNLWAALCLLNWTEPTFEAKCLLRTF